MLKVNENIRIIHRLARSTTAFVWIYQGLVPKLISFHSDELGITQAHGIIEDHAQTVIFIAGLLEIGFGILLLTARSASWPPYLSRLRMPHLERVNFREERGIRAQE